MELSPHQIFLKKIIPSVHILRRLKENVDFSFVNLDAMEQPARIDRQGGTITRAAAFVILFEEERYTRQRQKYMDVIIRSLKATLDECGAGGILEMNRSGLRIRPEKLDCDAYRFFSGDEETVKSYRGEYMNAYSWASMAEAYFDWMAHKES